MTRPQEDNEKCVVCQDVVALNEELEKDIRRMQRMALDLEHCYEEMCERHQASPVFPYVNSHLSRAIGTPGELMRVLSED